MTIPPVLIDTDFHTLADDHEALAMMATRHRERQLNLLSITTVTGNTWASTGIEHLTEAVKNLGLADATLAEGAGQPLLHRQQDFAHRSRLYGAAFGGAWGNADLLEQQVTQKPASKPGRLHAVPHLIKTILESPVSVQVLAIGPLTNIALALRIAPEIGQKIDRIVCMGGAIFVPGNVTPSAEFNWWFDPEAAAIVLEEDLNMLIVPLDATDRIVMDLDRYQRWQRKFSGHFMFEKFHRLKFESVFSEQPDFSLPSWDAVTAACMLESAVMEETRPLWVTVDDSSGPSYGRVVSYAKAGEFNLAQPVRQPAEVVMKVNPDAFWELYESLVFSSSDAARC